MPDLLFASDLSALPQTLRHRYQADADLAAATIRLNEAFRSHALWATGQHARASHSEVNGWFEQVAQLATDLMHALGHFEQIRPGPGFEDVLLHLMDCRPNVSAIPELPDRQRRAQHLLEFLARRAAPDMYTAAEKDRADDPAWEVANDLIGERLQSTLALLRLLATRGAAYHASFVRRGGKRREEARIHLFADLAGIYKELFGRMPPAPSGRTTRAEEAAGERRLTLPKGTALAWFRELVELVGKRAAAFQVSMEAPDADTTKLAGMLVRLANDAAESKSQDRLAHWIRDGASSHKKRRPRAPEQDDPDFASPPLQELFG